MKRGVDYIGVGTGAIIFNNEGKVFLTQRGPQARNESGKWDFPGGSVNFGEKVEDALKREIKEEFDFEIEIINFLEVVNHILPEEKQHWVSPSFIAKYKSGNPKIMEPEKCSEIKWVKLEEIDLNQLSMASKSNFLKYVDLYGYKSIV